MKRLSGLAAGGLWAVLAGAVVAAVVSAFGPLPHAILTISPTAAKLSPADTVQAENAIRNSVLQAVGGIVVVAGAITAWRQLVVSRRQYLLSRHTAVTEAFSKSIEQLSAPQAALRLGGVYSLDRVADDDPNERRRVSEILTSYVREGTRQSEDGNLAREVAAAVTILAGRDWPGGVDFEGIELPGADLRKARLARSRLGNTSLRGANLTGAVLTGSDLTGADLREARLAAADLRDTDLRTVRLSGARADASTRWPAGFAPSEHGVITG